MLVFNKITSTPFNSVVKYCVDVTSLRGLASIAKMPKEPLAARALKKYRQEKMANARFSDLIPGRVAMYILGNGGPGNPGVIYLTTDHKTYLFNCGEGAQRLSHEHGLKLTKLQHLFLTRTCWDTMGGLPGLSMTMQAMGIPALSIHSPKNITKLFELTKLFSITADMDIKEFDTTKDVFSDSTMDVSYVRVGDSSANGDNSKKVKLDREPVLCYICRLQRQPSSLNIRKCMELGIPKGPHLGILKNGGEYKFPDGRVVNYQDVTTLGEPGPVFIILDCPDIDYIDDLISNDELNECQSLQDEEKIPAYVIHFCPPNVLSDVRYQAWCEKFHINTTHLSLNQDNPLTGFRSAQLQVKLNMIDDEIFPLLSTENRNFSISSDSASQSVVMKAETKLKLNLRPMKDGKVDTQHVHRFSAEEFRQEVVSSQIEGFSEAVQVYKSKVSSLETSDSKHPEIIFLGTASSCPGKDRNVSAIWVNITDDVAILLDCGEGTYGQLVRLFGPDKVGSNLAKLKGIFISHLHADHQLGLIKVLIERSKFEKNPVHIILPSSVETWLKDYDQIYEKVKDTFIPYLSETVVANAPKTVLDDLRLIRLQTARVKHCRDSFGISITTANNDYFKISYSGDSAQPSPHFDSIAKSSNVLIHEATMEDELEEEAKIKNHSTTSQAIEVADRVNADYLILTHFSQRYAKLPIISEAMKKKKKIGIAFDNMRITRSNLRRLPLLFEPLEKLFVEYIEENLQRQQRKQIKQDQLAKLKLM